MARAPELEARSQPLSKSELLAACRGFQTGRRLQNRGYVQGRHLSCGATGEVFLGRVATSCSEPGIAPPDCPQVALKHMRAINAGIQRQIQQEISMVFHCRAKYAEEVGDPVSPGHPYLVAYLDWFAGPTGMDREVYLVMELCSFSLADMIFAAGRKTGPVAKVQLDSGRFRFPELEVLRNLLSALGFLHRHGIAHRDVKSENILWAQGPGLNSCYKLADFGTAVLLEEAARRRDETGTLWCAWGWAVAALSKPFNSKDYASRPRMFVHLSDVASLHGSDHLPEENALSPQHPANFILTDPDELLAYRNSQEALAPNSFWPFILGASAGGTPTASPSRGCKAIPSLPTHKSSRDVMRSNSTARPQRKEKRSVTLPPLSSCHREACQADECSSVDALHERRLAFLKKRCSFRWIYTEELKSLIFEDLLCEDAEHRSTAAALEESAALTSLADKAAAQVLPEIPPEAQSPEELLRCVCAENMLRALAASRKGQAAPEYAQPLEQAQPPTS
ncbi:max-2 [Symbiodinium pilosum]|uniref:Max-2 protein n=1 Tax=Symbiodinium pilosum TaxID=2952 RepID=A0A812T142_SYMPI|nr:max-2 [Symbiodinium pilosum]